MTIDCKSPAKTQADACTGKIYNGNRFFYNIFSESEYCIPCITELMVDEGEISSQEDNILELERVALQYNYRMLTHREEEL